MKEDVDSQKKFDPAAKVTLLAGMEGLICELDHSGDPEKERPAVNYFMLQLRTGTLLSIPICEYCAYELSRSADDFEWYLVYCENCGESKWLYKDNCKNKTYDQVNFVKSCPSCVAKNVSDKD